MYVHEAKGNFDRPRRRRLGKALVGTIVTLLAVGDARRLAGRAPARPALPGLPARRALPARAVPSVSGIAQTGPGLTEPTSPTGTRVTGGTVTFAEAPGSAPNYIFPGVSPQYCSIANVTNFNALMYRPLYWYGNNYSPTVDYDYSVGNQPVWSDNDKTVTVPLKDLEVVRRRAGDLARRRVLHQPLQGEPSRQLRVRAWPLPRQRSQRVGTERFYAGPASERLL